MEAVDGAEGVSKAASDRPISCPSHHPAFGSARQIELTFAVTFEKCRDTVIAVAQRRSSTSL